MNQSYGNSVDLGQSDVAATYGKVSPHIRRLAIFGPRGSGKTCYCASIYGHSSDGEATLSIDDPATMVYMENMWDAYESPDGFPAPTASEVPPCLAFDLAIQSTTQAWSLEILDHAGALIERQGHSEDELRKLVQGWLQECEAILVFLDASSQDSVRAIERRNEVAQLLGLLKGEEHTTKILKPIALVMTKWDERGVFPTEAEVGKLVNDFLTSNPQFKQIQDTLVAFGDAVKTFPVSSLGFNHKPGQKPTQPYNLLLPLVWVLQQTDSQRFQLARKSAADASSAKAVKIWHDLIRGAGISCGPIYAQILDELEIACRRRRAQRIRRVTVLVLFAVIVTWAGRSAWLHSAIYSFDAWDSFRNSDGGQLDINAGKRVQRAKQLLISYRGGLNPKQIRELDACILVDGQKSHEFDAKRNWERIVARNVDSPDGGPDHLRALQERKNELSAFSNQFEDTTTGQNVHVDIEECDRLIQQEQAHDREFKSVAAVETNGLGEKKVDYHRLIELWNNYRDGKDRSKFYRKEVDAHIAKLKKDHDASLFIALAQRISGDVHTLPQCGERLQTIDRFLEQSFDKTAARRDVENDMSRLLMKADQIAYAEAERAIDVAKKGLKLAQLREAQRAVAFYLLNTKVSPSSRDRPVKMKSAATSLQEWFKSIEKGRPFKVSLKSLFVPTGHVLFNNRSGASESYAYTIQASGGWTYEAKGKAKTPKTDTTVEGNGIRVRLSSLMQSVAPGDFDYQPGTTDVTITVWRSAYMGWYSATEVIDKEWYIPGRMAEGVSIRDDKGAEMILYIHCDGAEIPEVPKYR